MRPHLLAAALLAGLLAAWAGALALAIATADLGDGGLRLAAYPPWLAEDGAMAAIVAAEARPVRRTALPGTWVVEMDGGGAAALKASGAWLVTADVPFGPTLAGCSF